MKKPLAILVLIVSGAAGITLVAVLSYIIFLMASLMLPTGAEWVLYTVLVMFIYLASYPEKHLSAFYKEKYSVGTPVYLICFCAPAVIASVSILLVCSPVPAASIDSSDFILRFGLFAVLASSLGIILRETVTAVYAKRKKR